MSKFNHEFDAKMNIKFNKRSDRFCISKEPIEVESSNYKNKFKYERYIPIGISTDEVKSFLRQYPQEICFEITNKCNHFCPICIADSNISKSTFLSFSRFKEILSNLPHKIFRLTITGGEPLLHPEIVEYIDYGVKKSTVVLSTNGSQPKKISSLIRGKNSIIVAISIHGPAAIHDKYTGKLGAFENAIESIKLCLEQTEFVHVYTTVSQMNFPYIKDLSEILMKYPIKEHRLCMVKPIGRIEESVIEAEKIKINHIPDFKVYPLTIKHGGFPFLFVNAAGQMEIKDE